MHARLRACHRAVPDHECPMPNPPVTLFSCMKNEGAGLLEWIAYHRAIGVDDFLVYTNDCTDGTDTMLEMLQAKGIVQHRANPWVPGGELSGLSAVGGLQPGAASRLLVLPEPIGRLAAAICYEISDGEALARATSLGAEWLLTVANLDPYPIQLQKQFTNGFQQ